MRGLLFLATLFAYGGLAHSETEAHSSSLDYAQVTNVTATQKANGSWCFDVSVRHNDEGWDHYANGWEVVDQKGLILGSRPLAHPHDNEQPFTRRQCNIAIPDTVAKVIVRAKCNVHGFGGKAVTVNLNSATGAHYTVQHHK
ncbi:hypothetical protein AB4259_15635 [Vibrio amylolyticus]|uniref:hypothetical protein n=1 Tax=Vibrio amylolyticus TaxID=2847292 RepID=UPI0035526A12